MLDIFNYTWKKEFIYLNPKAFSLLSLLLSTVHIHVVVIIIVVVVVIIVVVIVVVVVYIDGCYKD